MTGNRFGVLGETKWSEHTTPLDLTLEVGEMHAM